MYISLEKLSVNSNDTSLATAFASSVENVTDLLNRTAQSLEKSRLSYVEDLRTEVKDVNGIIEDIATLNKQITDIMSGAGYSEQYGPNELLDKRNVLLDELSAFGKMDVIHQSDGSVTVNLNSHECIKADKFDQINFTENDDRTVSLKWKSNSENADSENGVLKASSEIINGRGVNNPENEHSSRGFKYYQDSLDAFAAKLSEVLNTTIPNELDSSGNVVSYKKLVGEYSEEDGKSFINTDKMTSALNITITDELYNDPTYAMYDSTSSDGTYFTKLIGRLEAKQTFNNGAEEYSGTFTDYLREYASRIGGDVSYTKDRYEACETYSNELLSNRENVTGVSETEETVSMLTYNRAFQAAAKMMTTMDELLDVVINQVGALG